jgi:hypothetical protein
MRSVILTALDDTQRDVDAVRKNLENWFDGTMDRVSGWYRRRTQTVLFLIGIIAATALNVDSITIATRLTSDKALRNAIVASAQKQAVPSESQTYADLSNGLTKIGFPIGYKNGFYPEPQMCDFQGDCTFRFEVFVRTVLGWFVTAFAIMLGAPFWFDVLNKFMVVRRRLPRPSLLRGIRRDKPVPMKKPAGLHRRALRMMSSSRKTRRGRFQGFPVHPWKSRDRP